MPTTSQLKGAAITIALLAVLMRVPGARDVVLGDDKLFGIF